ncbi:LCP family protein [Leifsonia sp. TF02-11]|uniref:LCP family protein n=1 Tax=Leifsonia sp. TF02-11 TaxID=2815212 RepID=UPI001AA12B24|nr:LCP family protein [Leifsonia sp. TF02-11]MBO1740120.1 LCP family protein [Leifsonia sp. TF02-11]
MSDLEELEAVFESASASRSDRRKRKRRRRRALWIWVTAVIVVLVLPVALVGGYLVWLGGTFDNGVRRITNPFPADATRPPAVNGATNFLLIGSDSRSGLNDVLSGKRTGERSDTLMLVNVPADGSGITVVSLMRDLWVPVPGHGSAKLNAAFSWGGVPLAVQSVESLLKARIDHVMVVDFGGFGSISTALGGVEVWSDRAFESKNMPGYTFTKGFNRLEGTSALAFVRERYSFGEADYQRVRNQQAFIRALVLGFIDTGTLTNPLKLQSAVGTLARYIVADGGLTSSAVAGLALRSRGLSASGIDTWTLPTAGTGTSPDGQSIVLVDEARLELVRTALAHDDLATTFRSGKLGSGER